MVTHTHPYQIFVFIAARGSAPACWTEPYAAATESHAVYLAGLVHKESRAVVKVVRFGHNLLCLPDAHAVELCEKQVARSKEDEKPY